MIPAEHPPRSPTTTQEPHLQPGRVARSAATPWPATYNCPSFSGSHLTPRSERGLALPHTTFIGVTEHRRRPIGPARKAPWTAVRCVGSARIGGRQRHRTLHRHPTRRRRRRPAGRAYRGSAHVLPDRLYHSA